MEKQNPKARLVEESQSYKMIIPLDVELKIRRLLQEIYNIEWSGILFCTHEGTFENKDLVITCRDILPLNIGNSVFTEFEMSPDVISYMVDKDLMDCDCHLVHSHHNMDTFFSGTDTETLAIEGSDRNNFVSLIVNNAGKYNAKITSKETITCARKGHKVIPFFGKEVSTDFEDTVTTTIVHAYPLVIEKAYGSDTELLACIKELKDKNEAAAKRFYKEQSKLPIGISRSLQEPTLFDNDEDWRLSYVREQNEKLEKLRNTKSPEEVDYEDLEGIDEVGDKAAAKLLSLSLAVTKIPKVEVITAVEKVFKEDQLTAVIAPFVEIVLNDAEMSWDERFNQLDSPISIIAGYVIDVLEEYKEFKHVEEIINELIGYGC